MTPVMIVSFVSIFFNVLVAKVTGLLIRYKNRIHLHDPEAQVKMVLGVPKVPLSTSKDPPTPT